MDGLSGTKVRTRSSGRLWGQCACARSSPAVPACLLVSQHWHLPSRRPWGPAAQPTQGPARAGPSFHLSLRLRPARLQMVTVAVEKQPSSLLMRTVSPNDSWALETHGVPSNRLTRHYQMTFSTPVNFLEN